MVAAYFAWSGTLGKWSPLKSDGKATCPKWSASQTVTYHRFWKMVVASKLPHGLLSGSWVRGGLDVLKRRVESILALFVEALPHPPSCAAAPLNM